jgi:hypothetical protein
VDRLLKDAVMSDPFFSMDRSSIGLLSVVPSDDAVFVKGGLHMLCSPTLRV